MITRTFAGVDQPDVASMQIGDAHYTCTVYRTVNRTNEIDFGVSLRSRCFVKQGHGQPVELFDLEIANPVGGEDSIDSPKIIAVGTTFVVVYAENNAGTSRSLNMATLDMTTVPVTWADQGSISTHDSALFDICGIQTDSAGLEFHATDYFVVHRIAGTTDQFAVRRHNGFDWVSTAALTNYTAPDLIADRILAAYSYESLAEPFLLVSYQTDDTEDMGGGIRTARFTSTNAVNTHDTETFPDTTTRLGALHAVSITQVRRTSQRFVVAAEVAYETDLADYPYKRQVIYTEASTVDLSSQSEEHGVYNVHLLSRLFIVPSQSDIQNPSWRVRCVMGFRTMEEGAVQVVAEDGTTQAFGGPWTQTYAYVADLARDSWSAADEFTARPFIVSQLNRTLVDSRAAGYVGYLPGPAIDTLEPGTRIDARRTNHLSHLALPPDFGPDVKSFTVALGGWTRNISVGNAGSTTELDDDSPVKLEPVDAMIMNWELHYEEPWVVWRDGRTQPLENFSAEYALAMQNPQQVGQLLLLGGGTPSVYDGVQTHELGFPWYPEIVGVTFTSHAPSTLAEGVYYYSAIYEWPDSLGNIHRSTFSVPTRVEIVDPQQQVNFLVRTMTMSLKDNTAYFPDSGPIRIVIYRTAVDGQTLYRLFCLDQGFNSTWALANTPRNDPNEWAVPVIDSLPDATIVGVGDVMPWQPLVVGEQVLDPGPIPAATAIAVWQERVWLASLEDPDVLYYSMSLQRGFAPEFSDANTFRRDNLGPVVAMASMDTQLIIFTKDRIYALLGLVNDDLGRDAALELRLLAGNTGCINPRSVVITPGDGIFFQSRRGYYQLDRGGALNYIGADVEDYVRDAGSILGASYLEDRHQLRLVCNSAPTGTAVDPGVEPVVLVFDTLFKWWGRHLPPVLGDTDRGPEALDGVQWRIHPGEVSHAVLLQEGLLVERARDDVPYGDNVGGSDIGIPVDVQTSWISTAGIVGLQRIWEIMLMLERPAASQLTVTIEYSLGGYGVVDYTQNVVFASGAELPLRIRPRVQKCAAFRLRIRESGTVPADDSLSVTGITLRAGTKSRIATVPSGQSG